TASSVPFCATDPKATAHDGLTLHDALPISAGNVSSVTSFSFTLDTIAPAIAINTIAGDNVVNASEANAGFAISGTTSGVENGQTMTSKIVDSQVNVVYTYTTTASNKARSVP